MMRSMKTLKKKLNEYFSQFVYGSIDGTVTTFAVVAGSYGAGIGPKFVLILGVANLVGDGFSMAASAYVSRRSEQQQKVLSEKRYHTWYANSDARVSSSLRNHFMKDYGFEGKLLEDAESVALQDENKVIRHLMHNEFGMLGGDDSKLAALKIATATFAGFVVAGSVPLVTYIIGLGVSMSTQAMFYISLILTAVTFATIGYLKGRVTDTSHLKSLVETLLLGSIAALLAYGLGNVLTAAIKA